MKIGENGDPKRITPSDEAAGRQGSPVAALPDLNEPVAKTDLIAADILAELRDEHSLTFYRLVARRIPEAAIRQVLSEIKQDPSVKDAPRLFTARMNAFAIRRLARTGLMSPGTNCRQ